jgi:hypothetical protein
VRRIRPIAIIANGMMLASTLIDGGHYFIDLIVGLVVALLAILVARHVGSVLASRPLAHRLEAAQDSMPTAPEPAS